MLAMLTVGSAAAQDGGHRPQAPPAGAEPPRMGAFVSQIDGLAGPCGVAIGPDGAIYVADADSHSIRVFDRQGKALRTIGARGTRAGQFCWPSGVAFGPDGLLYVADSGNHRIQILSPAGEHKLSFSARGALPGQVCFPLGVAVRGELVFVADTGNDRVQVFNRRGQAQLVIETFGREAGRFNRPMDVAIDDSGNLYVADADNHRVQRFNARGEFERAWGEYGSMPGMLAIPTGVCWRDGRLYVADSGNHRIQAFDAQGAVAYEWGAHVVQPHEGSGKIHYPGRVAVAPNAELAVVSEALENRVQIFGPAAPAPARPPPPPINRMDDVHFGMWIDAAGSLLAIPETDTNTMGVHDASGPDVILISRFGAYGDRLGDFNRPGAVWLDRRDFNLWVSDAGNRRLEMFQLDYKRGREVEYQPNLSRAAQSIDLNSLSATINAPNRVWDVEATNLSFGKHGELYLVDARNARVFVLDKNMGFLREIGGYGTREGEFERPVAATLARDGETLYVLDERACRVQAFDAKGRVRLAWGRFGPGEGEFLRPTGIWAGVDGHVYVVDAVAARVQEFNERGKFVKAWGRPGVGAGEFWRPTSIAQDDRKRLYVLDYGNHRVQVFTPEGEFLDAFGRRLYVRAAKPIKRPSPPPP
jgi:DNA-binding beta-propeller fold protein YncE